MLVVLVVLVLGGRRRLRSRRRGPGRLGSRGLGSRGLRRRRLGRLRRRRVMLVPRGRSGRSLRRVMLVPRGRSGRRLRRRRRSRCRRRHPMMRVRIYCTLAGTAALAGAAALPAFPRPIVVDDRQLGARPRRRRGHRRVLDLLRKRGRCASRRRQRHRHQRAAQDAADAANAALAANAAGAAPTSERDGHVPADVRFAHHYSSAPCGIPAAVRGWHS